MNVRSQEWTDRADEELGHARAALSHGKFGESKTYAMQAARCALRAPLAAGSEGTPVDSLLAALERAPWDVPAKIVRAASDLDRQAAPRSSLTTSEIHTWTEARESIGQAELIIRYCHELLTSGH